MRATGPDQSSSFNTIIEGIDLRRAPFARDRWLRLDLRAIAVFDSVIGGVDLSRVVGTCHVDYAGRSWAELKPVPGTLGGSFVDPEIAYQPLKRAMGNIDALARNPHYYLSGATKEHWSFYRIGNDYYISEGNDRTVVARYFLFTNGLPQIVRGVAITSTEFLPTKPTLWPRFSRSKALRSRLFSTNR